MALEIPGRQTVLPKKRTIGYALLTPAVALHAPNCRAGEESHRFYAVNGTTLYVESFGNGPSVLFLHGDLMFFDSVSPTARLLSKEPPGDRNRSTRPRP